MTANMTVLEDWLCDVGIGYLQSQKANIPAPTVVAS